MLDNKTELLSGPESVSGATRTTLDTERDCTILVTPTVKEAEVTDTKVVKTPLGDLPLPGMVPERESGLENLLKEYNLHRIREFLRGLELRSTLAPRDNSHLFYVVPYEGPPTLMAVVTAEAMEDFPMCGSALLGLADAIREEFAKSWCRYGEPVQLKTIKDLTPLIPTP